MFINVPKVIVSTTEEWERMWPKPGDKDNWTRPIRLLRYSYDVILKNKISFSSYSRLFKVSHKTVKEEIEKYGMRVVVKNRSRLIEYSKESVVSKSTIKKWFDDFWKEYPKRLGLRRGKTVTRNKWISIFSGLSESRAKSVHSDILDALAVFREDQQVKDGFPYDAIRFLTSYTDWLEDDLWN